MSAATSTILSLVGTAAAAGGVAYGAHTSGKSAQRASDVQAKADAATLAENQARDAEAKRQFDIQQANDKAQRDRDNAIADYNHALTVAQEARRAPYRAASAAALSNLGQLLGLNLPTGPAVPNPADPLAATTASAPTGTPLPSATSGYGMGLPQSPLAAIARPSTLAPQAPQMTGPATSANYAPVNPQTMAQLLQWPPPPPPSLPIGGR